MNTTKYRVYDPIKGKYYGGDGFKYYRTADQLADKIDDIYGTMVAEVISETEKGVEKVYRHLFKRYNTVMTNLKHA